jgi:hypothetical protein
MAPSETAKRAALKPKPQKEKIFHPESRKAGQLARTQLRKSKLTEASSKRHKKFSSQSMSEYIFASFLTNIQQLTFMVFSTMQCHLKAGC